MITLNQFMEISTPLTQSTFYSKQAKAKNETNNSVCLGDCVAHEPITSQQKNAFFELAEKVAAIR